MAEASGEAVDVVTRYLPDRKAAIDALVFRYMAGLPELLDDLTEEGRRSEWADPPGLLMDAFVAYVRAAPGVCALWFRDDGPPPEMREAVDAALAACSDGLERLLSDIYGLERGPRLAVLSRAVVIAIQAVGEQAFRIDPDGDPDLIEEAKELARARLARFVRARSEADAAQA